MRIYYNLSDSWACGHYRGVLPHRHCARKLWEEGIQLDLQVHMDVRQDYDVYVFHRIVAPQFLPQVIRLKNAGKRIIWETDDLLTQIPEGNPARNQFLPNMDGFNLCLELADQIVVTTEEMRKQIPHGEKAIVLPNLVDVDEWSAPRARPDGVFRVMWAGSDSHGRDLEILEPVVRELVDRHADLEFVFFGMTPEKLQDHRQVVSLPIGPLSQYPGICSLISPHVALAPLQPNPFNRSKSSIKWMEGALSGAVVVASPLEPYTSVINDGLNGYLADTTEDWVDILEHLYQDRRRLATVARTGMEDVYLYHSWQRNAEIWMEYFRGLA